MRRRLSIAGFLLLLAIAARADDFYDVRLRVGQEAYREKRYREAADNFRIAVFGMLDRPPVLSQALARLALAQEAAGRKEDADAALSKFLLVERQFGVYDSRSLEAPVGSEFHALLARRVPAETLRSMPRLAFLGGSPKTP
jgi:hypothetical protein